jgi:DNA-binding NarL/FixJ family response regulator
MIRLLVADDHPIVREGLMRVLEATRGMRVVAEAKDGHAVLRLVEETDVDVVLLDISMPGPGFLELLKRLKKLKPRLPVLVLSVHPEEQFATQALRAGAAGYLTKNQSPDQLVDAITKVLRGGRYITPSLAERLASSLATDHDGAPHEELSSREFQVLCLLGSGKTARDVAEEISLSVKTVNTYRERLRQKLGLRNNAEVVRYAVEHGLIH